MLPVQSIFDVMICVKLVQDPICIILHGRCKDYYLVELWHLAKELLSVGPYQEMAPTISPTHLEEMNKSLI